MTAAVCTTAASSRRLLADVRALSESTHRPQQPALVRLETKIGRDLADRLVSALSVSDRRSYS